MLHPFREGNGRTERVFFIQLIRNAGYDIDYTAMQSDILMIGSIQASSGVMDMLKDFLIIIFHRVNAFTPRRVGGEFLC